MPKIIKLVEAKAATSVVKRVIEKQIALKLLLREVAILVAETWTKLMIEITKEEVAAQEVLALLEQVIRLEKETV
jgi:hypothetical protein